MFPMGRINFASPEGCCLYFPALLPGSRTSEEKNRNYSVQAEHPDIYM